jgi:hypothetical protein
MNEKKDLRQLFQKHFPSASREELEKRAAAHLRTLDQLRNEARELQAELEARRGNPEPPPWPGAIEPLVLAAAFLLGGEGHVDSIAEKVLELSSKRHQVWNVRSTVHRLVRRGLLSEHDRCFTITPQGESELTQARDDAKRWIDALGYWPGPSAANR